MTVVQKMQDFETSIKTNAVSARTALKNAMTEGKTANQVAKDMGMLEAIQLTTGVLLAIKGQSPVSEEQWLSISEILSEKEKTVSTELSDGIVNGAEQEYLANLLGIKETVTHLLESHKQLSLV